jgi:hypothetical protein
MVEVCWDDSLWDTFFWALTIPRSRLSARMWSVPHAATSRVVPRSHQTFYLGSNYEIAGDYVSKIDVGPPLFTLLEPEMSTDDVKTGRCDQPIMPQSHQTFHPVPTMKLLGIMFKNRCWPTTFHTITAGDANGWCLNWLVCHTTNILLLLNASTTILLPPAEPVACSVTPCKLVPLSSTSSGPVWAHFWSECGICICIWAGDDSAAHMYVSGFQIAGHLSQTSNSCTPFLRIFPATKPTLQIDY